MGSKKINRLTVYTAGETISANEHNAEHQQYVDNFNELFKSFDYDGVFHYPFASKVKFEYTDLKLEDLLKVAVNPDGTIKGEKVEISFSDLSLNDLLITSVNPDGTIKAEKVVEPSFSPSNLKDFLSVAHNPDGTIKSDGIDSEELYAHNHDKNAHIELNSRFVKKPFVYGNFSGKAGETVVLYATGGQSIGGVSYKWELPNGSVSYGDSVSFEIPTNASNGDVLTIKCYTVNDDGFTSEPTEVQIVVSDNPLRCDFALNSEILECGRTYELTISANKNVDSYNVKCSSGVVEQVGNGRFSITFPKSDEDLNALISIEVVSGSEVVRQVLKRRVKQSNNKIIRLRQRFKAYDSSCCLNSSGVLLGASLDTASSILMGFDHTLNLRWGLAIDDNRFRISGIGLDDGYILSLDGKYLVKLDNDGNVVKTISLDTNLSKVSNIFSCLGGDIYVGSYWYDSSNRKNYHVLLKFDSSLNFIKGVKIPLSGDTYTLGTDGVNIYALFGKILLKFDENLSLLKAVKFNNDALMSCDGNNIYVAEKDNGVVLKLDTEFNLLKGVRITADDVSPGIEVIYAHNNKVYLAVTRVDGAVARLSADLVLEEVYRFGVSWVCGVSIINSYDDNLYMSCSLRDPADRVTVGLLKLKKLRQAQSVFGFSITQMVGFKAQEVQYSISNFSPSISDFTPQTSVASLSLSKFAPLHIVDWLEVKND